MNHPTTHRFNAVVIGGSAGALEILNFILGELPSDYFAPIMVCQHLHVSDNGHFARHLGANLAVRVVEAWDKTAIQKGCVYTAPANYHLLVERDDTLALTVDEKVRFSRPSIDVLFESAAYVYADALIAVLLSGASTDGTDGMRTIQQYGGVTIAQSAQTAIHSLMPKAAADAGAASLVLSPKKIAEYLLSCERSEE